jgi:hypothetical protein
MLTLDAIRSVYAARFGAEFEAETVWDKDLRNGVLVACFWAGVAPVVYASLGGRGHEITLVSPVPFPELAELVGKVAHAASAAPLGVIAYRIERTPFDGLLFLPPEDGTFVLGHVDGVPRYALRAVPITPAERRLAADSPGKVLALLRKAGALEADLLRDCVVEPKRTRRFWAHNKPALFMAERRRMNLVIERMQRLRELNAPHEFFVMEDRLLAKRRAVLAYLQASPADRGSPEHRIADQLIKEVTTCAKIIERVTGAYGSLLPPRVLRATMEMLLLVLTTHPEAVRLMAFVEGTGLSGKPWSADAALVFCADMIVRSHRRLKPEKLVARGRTALEGAARSFEPDRGVPFDSFAWAQMLRAMLAAAAPPSGGTRGAAEDTVAWMEDEAIRSAFRDCPEALMRLEVDADASRSPRERLHAIGEDLGSRVLMHFTMAAKGQQTEH